MSSASRQPQPGEVWDRIEYATNGGAGHFVGDPLRITRAGEREGDWIGRRLKPLAWEPEGGHEWRITREQLRGRRYMRRLELEAHSGFSATPTTAASPVAAQAIPKAVNREPRDAA